MKYLTLFVLFSLLLLPGSPAIAGKTVPVQDPHSFLWDPHRPDSHAPIGVMADHTHEAGEFMLSYRFRFMNMEGMRLGSGGLSAGEVFDLGYLITPRDMQMDMHMLGFMVAPSDWLTLVVMANYAELRMDHVTRPGFPPRTLRGPEFRTKSSGWGDTRFRGLIKVLDRDHRRAHLHLGFSAPTGTIDEVDSFTGAALPYSMQIGSGSWDLLVGATYLQQFSAWSWGVQGTGTVRLEDNGQNYRLGDRFDATAWLAIPLASSFSVSGRIAYATVGDIEGADPRLAAARALGMNGVGVVPTVNTGNYGRDRLDLSLGLNWYGQRGWLRGHRFAIEAGVPVFRHHSGPFLETDYWITAGWQKAF